MSRPRAWSSQGNRERHSNFSNNTSTTHYDSLQVILGRSNEVIMTSLQGQLSGPMKTLGNL